MTVRRLKGRALAAVLSVATLPALGGCFGSGYDKGDNASVGTGTARPMPQDIDASVTGGLGGIRDNVTPLPGGTGPKPDGTNDGYAEAPSAPTKPN